MFASVKAAVPFKVIVPRGFTSCHINARILDVFYYWFVKKRLASGCVELDVEHCLQSFHVLLAEQPFWVWCAGGDCTFEVLLPENEVRVGGKTEVFITDGLFEACCSDGHSTLQVDPSCNAQETF